MRADGSEFPLELSIAAVDVPGEPVFTAYLRDISEHKRREAALLESEAIVDSSFDAIIGRTTDGIVTSWNAAAERIFGYSAEEMIGRSVAILDAARAAGVLDYVNERLRRGEVVEPFEAVLRAQGRHGASTSRSTVSPIVGASGDAHRRLVHLARHHRAQALAGARGRAGGAARVRRRRRRAAARARPPGALRRGARRRRARLDPAARPRRRAPAARRRAEPARRLLRGDRRRRDRPERRILRHRRLPPRARVRLRHRERPALERFPRAGARPPGSRACWSTPIFATDGALLGTFALYYREPRERGAQRPRARRARDARGRHRDRARALRGSGARERGALPRPLRERQRADRDRHDGRAASPRSTARSSACSATRATS